MLAGSIAVHQSWSCTVSLVPLKIKSAMSHFAVPKECVPMIDTTHAGTALHPCASQG